MRYIRRGKALGVVAITVLAVAIAAPSAMAATTPARANLVKAVGTASAQAKKLITRSSGCPSAARQRAITSKVRTAQTTRLARADATSLRLRQMRITEHARRLAVALTGCSRGGSAAPGAGSPVARGLDGSLGGTGANGADGTNTAPVSLSALGDVLDATGLLDGGVLPASIPDVASGALATTPACLVSGATCVGVDPASLLGSLTDAVAAREQELPVLSGVLDPLLAQVGAILSTGDPSSLIDVQRTGDSTLVVSATPGSALAGLLSLLNATGSLPANPVATVQVHA